MVVDILLLIRHIYYMIALYCEVGSIPNAGCGIGDGFEYRVTSEG